MFAAAACSTRTRCQPHCCLLLILTLSVCCCGAHLLLAAGCCQVGILLLNLCLHAEDGVGAAQQLPPQGVLRVLQV